MNPLLRYVPPPAGFDEAVAPDGRWRPAWSAVASMLGEWGPGEWRERQRLTDRLLDAEGAGHLVHELAFERPDAPAGVDSRPWRIDPIPLVVDHSELAVLAAGVVQRARLAEALLADLAGERLVLRRGVVPPAAVFGSTALRTGAPQLAPSRWIVHHTVDLVRTTTGEWRVVQDLTDTASGLGYALLNRSVVARAMPAALRGAGAAPIAAAATLLRGALGALTPARNPRTVVLTGGPSHPTYVEHSYLAVQMGFHLAEGGDLVVRRNRVWLRALDGVEPVDVVYRRLEDAGLDPLASRAVGTAGVPAISWAAQSGGVVLANAAGAQVAEDRAVFAHLPDAARCLLGEELQIAQLGPADELATAPSFGGEHHVAPARVVLRLHAIAGPDGVTVVPGGTGRVLGPGDDLRHPTAQLAKDVWVVGGPSALRPVRVVAHPQVDFGASVPKRAADALYWIGRAAERAEIATRTIRVVGEQVEQDASLLSGAGGGWPVGGLSLLRAAQAMPLGGADDATPGAASFAERIIDELAGARRTVATQIATIVQEATTVREFLSTTTGRVLGRLARAREHLRDGLGEVDDLDVVLVDLAALAGLAMESTVRGPAWRFLDLGRRLERSLGVLGSIQAGLGPATEPLALQPLAEAVLAVNESLVAYRRRYRSDVELAAVLDLLVHDDSNPRSLAFQLDRLREHVASLGWIEGAELVQQASLAALHPYDTGVAGGRRLSIDALVLETRGPLLALGDAIAARWFSDPVNPVPMGHR